MASSIGARSNDGVAGWMNLAMYRDGVGLQDLEREDGHAQRRRRKRLGAVATPNRRPQRHRP